MNNAITLKLDAEQIEALRSGSITITIEPPKQVITKWEPKSGDFRIAADLTVIKDTSSWKTYALAGLEYQTKTQAEQAAKALYSYARQLNWLHENDDGWVADWNDSEQDKYFIYYHSIKKEYRTTCTNCWMSLQHCYMSRDNAEKLCKLLNDGIVEF